jgi:hypothetical protein
VNESIYVSSLAGLLLISAVAHFLLPSQVAKWLRNPVLIRFVGAFLLLLALPCLWWRGWYFWTLFGTLVISGVWRLFFPHHSIHAQETTYPRWVHGCLLFGCAVAVWALRP